LLGILEVHDIVPEVLKGVGVRGEGRFEGRKKKSAVSGKRKVNGGGFWEKGRVDGGGGGGLTGKLNENGEKIFLNRWKNQKNKWGVPRRKQEEREGGKKGWG